METLYGFLYVLGAIIGIVFFICTLLVLGIDIKNGNYKDVPKEIMGALVVIFFLCFMVQAPTPSANYAQIGLSDSKIVIDQCYDGKVIGKDIRYIDKDHSIIFTTNPEDIGKFRYAFGWREYRDAKEDVKDIVAERDGLIYYLAKSDGKIHTMAQK